MFKKLICFFMALSLMFILSLSAFASSNSDLFYNDYGYLTYISPNFNSSIDYSTYFDFNPTNLIQNTPEFTVPSGMTQFCYSVYTGLGASRCQLSFVYCTDGSIPIYFSSGTPSLQPSSDSSFYEIRFWVNSSGQATPLDAHPVSNFSCAYKSASFLIPIQDTNGNILRPAADVQFTLNTAVIGYNLSVNSQINSGDASSVDYYIFPSTTPISSGSTSTIVPFTPASELTETQQENFLLRGFKLLTYGVDDLIIDIASPKVSLTTSSSVRSFSLFDPTSYGVSFEKIGVGRLYPSSGVGGITPTATLSLKDMISSHTGVYASSTLKLVAVVNTSNTSFVATFDFAPAAIVGGSPVPPTTLQGQVPYPDFNNPNSDFKELADYLKHLLQANNDNSIRNNSNMLAMLNSIPWTNFVTGGFVNGLPNLSFMLDSLFDSLFDKFTAPTQEQIDAILADINTERTSLRAKLAFVDDVKTEYYFVISTITADNNSIPPDFEFSLPSIWSNGQDIRVKLISYEIATPEIMANIKQVITVFLSLALLLHIWRTLPATVGNMPRGDV